mmetsp:Transcript_8583/g.14491  ORF Transcript_8583/g.14491 Transcript_8583/m.14491 type:complete len:168 (+) Transcript_8583:189-692(+)
MVICFIVIGIMVLSIVSSDNFGDDYKESFDLQSNSSKGYRNAGNGSDSSANSTEQASSTDEESPKEEQYFKAYDPVSLSPFNRLGYVINYQCPIPKSFVQGLEVLDDQQTLIVSGGLYGQSTIYTFKYDFATCHMHDLKKNSLGSSYFAEGLTVVGSSESGDPQKVY